MMQREHVLSIHTVIALSIAGISCPIAAAAGTFTDAFRSRLDAASPSDWVPAIVVLEPAWTAEELAEEARAEGRRSRWRIHEYVVREARARSGRAESMLLDAIGPHARRGDVRNVHPFWVTNAVAITARPATFEELVRLPNVRRIEWDAPVEPNETAFSESRTRAGVNHAHAAIHLDAAWDLGVTGAGRLVCIFDSGVDGDHEALAASWRGQAGVPWYHAWFDPTDHTEVPTDIFSGHGTEVMGAIVARPPGAPPLGVAPDAAWIAGKIRFGTGGSTTADIYSLFQWAADPDSNPSTIDDVPDVINHSWGTSEPCADTFWEAIDLVEAAGIANVIAVANTGPGGVRSPESRAETPYQNFSVGNVNTTLEEPLIYPSSGRGPSPCDGISKKPELTAPGTSIETTAPDDRYGTATGASLAAPHVSGAIALLREVDPDIDVTAAKDLLMQTATDLGSLGEDNDYGWGILNVASAVQALLARDNPLLRPVSPLANLVGVDSVGVRWSAPITPDPTTNVLEYRVYRAMLGEEFPTEPIASVPATVHEIVDGPIASGSYVYVVTAAYAGGESGPSRMARVSVPRITSTPPAREIRLLVAPNPFSPSAEIRFEASAGEQASLTVHDAGGRMVRDLGVTEGGTMTFDGRDEAGLLLPAGVYFVRVRQGSAEARQRMILLR